MRPTSLRLAQETDALADAAIAACHYLDAVRSVARGTACRDEADVVRELLAVRAELQDHACEHAAVPNLEALRETVGSLAKSKIRSARLARVAVLVSGVARDSGFDIDNDVSAFATWIGLLPVGYALVWMVRTL